MNGDKSGSNPTSGSEKPSNYSKARAARSCMSEGNIFQRLLPEAVLVYGRKTWLRVVTLIVAGFATHFPALQGQLVWDDDYLVKLNAFIKSPLLILETFRHYLFLDAYSTHYRPVQNLSYMVDYGLWDNNLYGFHLTNIFFHTGSALLLFLLLRRLLFPLLNAFKDKDDNAAFINPPSASSLLAFLIALIWVVHPVHSAAVDYISGRADSLAFFFACWGWLSFLKARETPKRFFRYLNFALAWGSGLLSLCSRESACIWIILFILYLFSFEKTIAWRRKFIVLLACLSLFGVYATLRHLPGPRTQTEASSEWSAPVRVTLMCRALGDYSRLMLFPANLHMERSVFTPESFRSEKSWHTVIGLEYLAIAGILTFLVLIYGALKSGPGQRMRIFGAAWFLVGYLPISNLIDLNATVAEHWLYLPSVGLLIFLAGVAVALPPIWRKTSVALAYGAILALGIRSTIRSGNWITNETFARQTMAAGGGTIRIAILLGQAYEKRHEYAEAERIYRRALQNLPNYPIARNNLANVLLEEGKEKEAKEIFAAATEDAHEIRKEYPRTWILALNLAHVYHGQHNDTEALAVLQRARMDYPKAWDLIRSEGELLREVNRLDEAIALVRDFAQNNWWHYEAAVALGRLYMAKGEVDLAHTAFRRASWLDIHETQALNLIAMIRMNQHRFDDAYTAQRRAVSRQPDEPRQYLILSDILEKMGRQNEALATIAQADRLQALAKSQPVVN